MAKTKITKKTSQETDGVFLLKIVLYIVLGSQWLFIETAQGSRIPLPAGFVLGIIFAMHDHFQIDRKIEFAVLAVAALFGFIASVGLIVSI